MRRARLGAVLILIGGFLASDRTRAETPIFGLDLRVGDGIGIAGGHGHTAYRKAPPTLGLQGEYTLYTEPFVTLFGGLYMEAIDRWALGLQGGLRIKPLGAKSGVRLGASLVGLLVPYTLFGVTAEGGYCIKIDKKDRFRPCIDLQAVVFFIGNDLPKSGVAAQVNVLVGVHFNAL